MVLEEVEFRRLSNGVYFHLNGWWYKKTTDRSALRSDGVLILDGTFRRNNVPVELPSYKVEICREFLRKNPMEVQNV